MTVELPRRGARTAILSRSVVIGALVAGAALAPDAAVRRPTSSQSIPSGTDEPQPPRQVGR